MIMVPASLSTYDGPPGFRSVEITDIVRGRRPPARAGQPVGRRGTPSRRPLAFGVMSEAAQPATLFLLRHGETAHHAENRYLGSTDEPLNDRGFEQAEALGRWAARARLTAIVSSSLLRARQTAEPAVRATGLEHRIEPRLVELSFGRAENLTSAEMRHQFPAARAAFEVDPIAHPLPGGEDPLAALDRGRAAITELAENHPGGRILVVAHGTLLRIVLCDLLGISPSRYRRVFPIIANTSGAIVRYAPETGFGLVAYNPVLTPDSTY